MVTWRLVACCWVCLYLLNLSYAFWTEDADVGDQIAIDSCPPAVLGLRWEDKPDGPGRCLIRLRVHERAVWRLPQGHDQKGLH
jgi:hypothetical protein